MIEFRKPEPQELPELETVIDEALEAMTVRGIKPVHPGTVNPDTDRIFRSENKTVGMIRLKMPSLPLDFDPLTDGFPTLSGVIEWLCIAPVSERQGLGTVMLQIAEGIFMNESAITTEITVPQDNTVLRRFLAKNGYVEAETGRMIKQWVSRCTH